MSQYQGWQPTPPDIQNQLENLLAKTQGSPEFSDVGSSLSAKELKLCLLYKSCQKFFPAFGGDEPQAGPDCTTHATRNVIDISRAVEIDIKGEPEEFLARSATEYIYGVRGGGAGMNVGRATMWVVNNGILVRKKYPFADLSKYNFTIGNNWGKTSTPRFPAGLVEEAKKHPCRHWARIRTVEEARTALANGYALHCGSQYGNDGTRDSRGIARWTKSWNHDMAWGGFWEDDDLYFVVHQTWGNWNRGGHPPFGQLPTGSFLIPSKDAAKMLAQGEAYCIGDVDGFPARELPDYGFGSFV